MPGQSDPQFTAWDEADSMIMTWLWNLMLPEISGNYLYVPDHYKRYLENSEANVLQGSRCLSNQ